MIRILLLSTISLLFVSEQLSSAERQRVRDLGIAPGILTPGRWNAITDVAGVQVGHRTLIEGESTRTGVTVILPHDGNLFRERVPAAVYVGNGFGKAVGFTQVQELGELETPIALTNTLSVFAVAEAVADFVLEHPDNGDVRSVNPVVGETNDGWLNEIRERAVTREHVFEAFAAAASGPVAEGNVGAGTGTRTLGFKGGIGTSSRVLPRDRGGYTVGVLVQSNFGGILSVAGAPVGRELGVHYMAGEVPYDVDGSIMIVVATDAPLSPRNLERLGKRAFMAIGAVGGFASNGSGDYVIAFSTHPEVRRRPSDTGMTETLTDLKNAEMTPLFLAAFEATEEAILNSMFMAETMTGWRNRTLDALPLDEVRRIMGLPDDR
jgi:D-aminopeptidase